MASLKKIHQKLLNEGRFKNYKVYERLYLGQHFSAFSIKSEDFKDEYARLRYVVCNFAGLTSKVIADMLFGEPVRFIDDKNQKFIDALVFEKGLDTLFYEHSIANSYFGDNLFKIRVKDDEIFIEDQPPFLYLPELDPANVRAKPKALNLAWVLSRGDDSYLIVERHAPPKITTEVGQILKKGETIKPLKVDAANKLLGTNFQAEVDTKINRFLVKHVPNPKPRGHFGVSDYVDLKELVFALNNRMTKTDNILDKHSDPILALPEGTLDEEGKIKKEVLGMFEVGEGGEKPEYIIWNANLESALKQIDKLVEFLFMFSETSPDVLGLGKGGQAESGRALKMKLLRTIAKRNRKKLYYDHVIKDVIFTTELLAEANNYKISEDFKGLKPKSPQPPETKWQDGIVNDEVERTEIAMQQVDGGLLSKKRAIMDLHGVKDKEAEEIIKEIEEEGASSDFTSFVDKKDGDIPPVKPKPGEKKPSTE